MNIDRTFSIAPMMEYTDRHFRYLARIATSKTLLFTEMVTSLAVIHGDRQRLLGFDPFEKPLVAQLGGSDPAQLAECARIVEDFGYNEVNLNVGCPSERVKSGRFGACLMNEPDLVAECVQQMKQHVTIPVTVKSRTGVDNNDSYEALTNFVKRVSDAGCDALYLHARKAWLSGLSPKQNRTVPPLQHDMAYQLKADFAHLPIMVNGGDTSIEDILRHLKQVDGVMMGRAAYHDLAILCQIDRRVFAQQQADLSRYDILKSYLPYIERQLSQGVPLKHISRHLSGLFKGVYGGKKIRRFLSENAFKPGAGIALIEHALSILETTIED
jgi:tRNA-dihydrouridine synthase A